jgi:hypothetical protein
VLRRLSVYDGMTRLGGLTIEVSARRAAVINATNAKGKSWGASKPKKRRSPRLTTQMRSARRCRDDNSDSAAPILHRIA